MFATSASLARIPRIQECSQTQHVRNVHRAQTATTAPTLPTPPRRQREHNGACCRAETRPKLCTAQCRHSGMPARHSATGNSHIQRHKRSRANRGVSCIPVLIMGTPKTLHIYSTNLIHPTSAANASVTCARSGWASQKPSVSWLPPSFRPMAQLARHFRCVASIRTQQTSATNR